MRRVAALLLILPLAAALCPEGAFQGTRPEDCYVYGPAQSWQEAKQYCAANKGHLTSVPNAFVNAFLISYPKTFSSAQSYWLGAVIVGDIDMWTWTDGSSFNYTKWAAGEPKQGPGCLNVNASTGQWKSEDCGALKPFICKVPQLCKKRLSGVFNWDSAHYACRDEGAHLPSIHDEEENLAFAEVARGYPIVALGLKNTAIVPQSDDKPPYNYAWDDGSFLDYMKIPEDYEATMWMDCVFFQKEQTDKWLFMDCRQPDEMATAVCQKSPREA